MNNSSNLMEKLLFCNKKPLSASFCRCLLSIGWKPSNDWDRKKEKKIIWRRKWKFIKRLQVIKYFVWDNNWIAKVISSKEVLIFCLIKQLYLQRIKLSQVSWRNLLNKDLCKFPESIIQSTQSTRQVSSVGNCDNNCHWPTLASQYWYLLNISPLMIAWHTQQAKG